MRAAGRDREKGSERGGALSVASEQGNGFPGRVATAGVEVDRVSAGGRGDIVIGLHDERDPARLILQIETLDRERKVGSTAHDGVSVVDRDARAMNAVEGDANREAGKNVARVDVEVFFVGMDGA